MVLSLMDNGLGIVQYSAQQLQLLREMQRKANDRIRVFNPTNVDFIIRWDRYGFLIPNRTKDIGQGRGQAVVYRYVALNYLKHMSDKIIGEKLYQSTIKENQDRIYNRQLPMNKYDEQYRFEMALLTDSSDQRKALARILWLGVDEEYGLLAEESAAEQTQVRDHRQYEEQLVDELDFPASRIEGAVSIADNNAKIDFASPPPKTFDPDPTHPMENPEKPSNVISRMPTGIGDTTGNPMQLPNAPLDIMAGLEIPNTPAHKKAPNPNMVNPNMAEGFNPNPNSGEDPNLDLGAMPKFMKPGMNITPNIAQAKQNVLKDAAK